MSLDAVTDASKTSPSPKDLAREAYELVRRHLSVAALDEVVPRLQSLTGRAPLARGSILSTLGVADVQRLRLKAAAAGGVAQAARQSIARHVIAHEDEARQEHLDLTRAADLITELLRDAQPAAGA